jgi:hypothetical protein
MRYDIFFNDFNRFKRTKSAQMLFIAVKVLYLLPIQKVGEVATSLTLIQLLIHFFKKIFQRNGFNEIVARATYRASHRAIEQSTWHP